MEIYQLKYLKAVVDYQSYSKAAEALFVTQPTISIAIRKLEKTLQVTLLKRQGKAVVLTDIGERIYPACLRLLRDYESVLAEVESCRSSMQYDIHLAVPFFLYNKFILFTKTLFPARFPNYRFIIEQAGLNADKSFFIKIYFDMLITSKSSEIATSDNNLRVRNYTPLEYFAYFSNKSPLTQYSALTPKMLEHENLLFSKSSRGIGSIFNNYFSENGVNYNTTSEQNYTPDTLLNLVNANIGVALMPKLDIIPRDVSYRPLDPPLIDNLVFIYNSETSRHDSIDEIMDYLTELNSI